jgi:hypothetical protein
VEGQIQELKTITRLQGEPYTGGRLPWPASDQGFSWVQGFPVFVIVSFGVWFVGEPMNFLHRVASNHGLPK